MMKSLKCFLPLIGIAIVSCSANESAAVDEAAAPQVLATAEKVEKKSPAIDNGDGTITFPGPDGGLTLPAPPEGYYVPDRVASFLDKNDLAIDLNCRDTYDVIFKEMDGISDLERESFELGYLIYNAQVNQHIKKSGKPDAKDLTLGEITRWKGQSPESDEEFFAAVRKYLPGCSTRLEGAFSQFQANGNLGKGEKKK